MKKQLAIAAFLVPVLVLAASPAPSAAPQKKSKPAAPRPAGGRLADAAAVRIVSSSHQDIAWMDSPEKCMIYRDENCITPALAMMARDPAYRFTMENMLNLREYLDRHPERRAEVQRFTKAGRLEWGATFTQPYESLLSGEELVRQAYFGRRWLKKTLPGCDARVAFNPDVPGRALQMSQILSKAGIPYLVISRYHEGFYRWASPDGSSVLAYSPGHYGNASAILNAAPAEGIKAVAATLEKWTPYYAERRLPPVFPLLNSVDFSKPTDFGGLIAAWNEERRRPAGGSAPALAYASAREFFEAFDAPGIKLDTVTGERPDLWLYIHGPTHHEAIAAHREAGALLPAAEAFSTFRSLLEGSFRDYPARELQEAWEAAIYPDHGWGGKEGQVTDRLFRKKYEQARDTGRRLLDDRPRGHRRPGRDAPGPGNAHHRLQRPLLEKNGPGPRHPARSGDRLQPVRRRRRTGRLSNPAAAPRSGPRYDPAGIRRRRRAAPRIQDLVSARRPFGSLHSAGHNVRERRLRKRLLPGRARVGRPESAP